MNERQLKDGTMVKELDRPVTLQIKTKCPGKYMLIDLETGQKYRGYDTEGKNCWMKVEDA